MWPRPPSHPHSLVTAGERPHDPHAPIGAAAGTAVGDRIDWGYLKAEDRDYNLGGKKYEMLGDLEGLAPPPPPPVFGGPRETAAAAGGIQSVEEALAILKEHGKSKKDRKDKKHRKDKGAKKHKHKKEKKRSKRSSSEDSSDSDSR